MAEAFVEEARDRLLAHEHEKTLFTGLDASTAVMGLLAGLALSFIPMLFLGPLGFIVGFGGMYFWANRHSEKDRQRRLAYLSTADSHTIADKYCATFHPDRGAPVWDAMNRLRNQN